MKRIIIDFDKIYESNNYGPFKIIEDLGGGTKRVRIKFLNTGFEKITRYHSAINGEVRDNSSPYITSTAIQIDFDKIYESKNYGPFKIIEDLGGKNKRVRIRFLNTGFTNEVAYNAAINGEVRDHSIRRIAKDSVQIDFNKIYESKNYGPFKIIEDLGGTHKRVRIKFLNTGFINEVACDAAINGEVRDHSVSVVYKNSIQIDFDKIYESKNYGPFQIIEDLGGSPKRVRIRFLNTGCENIFRYDSVIGGTIRDHSIHRIKKDIIQIDFNNIYESKNYGPFKIIEDLEGSPKRVRIKFLNTGYENEVQYRNAINGNVRDYSLFRKYTHIQIDFDKIYESKNYGPFQIIEDLGGSPKRVRIRFLNTGFINEVQYTIAIKCMVRDYSLPYKQKNSIQIDFDKIYESNNYGPFKIIEDLGGIPKRVRIKFLNTGFEKEVQHYAAINSNVKDDLCSHKYKNSIKIDFDKVYESNNYGPFKIIEDLRGSPRRVRIKFIDTGFTNEVCYRAAIKGIVRDYSIKNN